MKNLEVSFSLLELEFHCKNLFFDMGKALVSKNLKSSARPVVASISRQRDTTWSIPLCAPKGARTAAVRTQRRETYAPPPAMSGTSQQPIELSETCKCQAAGTGYVSGHISLSAYEQVATSRFMCK